MGKYTSDPEVLGNLVKPKRVEEEDNYLGEKSAQNPMIDDG